MFDIQWVPLEDGERWNSFVKQFEFADIYYLHGYAKSFSIVTDGAPYLLYYNDGFFSAVNVVQKRSILGTGYYDLTSLYGYGGWIMKGDVTLDRVSKLFAVFSSDCLARNIVSEVIRVHPVSCSLGFLQNWYEEKIIGPIVNINLTLSDMWNDMPSKSKNVIRKAEKLGVQVKFGDGNVISSSAFKAIYDETMVRANASDFYFFSEEFHESFERLLSGSFSYFIAVLDNEILCAAIVTHVNGMLNYHLSGSRETSRGIPAMNLLINHAINWGHQQGYRSFNLGGGVGTKEDSLFKFKQSFTRSSSTSFSLLTKIFDERRYNELVEEREKLSGEISDNNYFPKYRAV